LPLVAIQGSNRHTRFFPAKRRQHAKAGRLPFGPLRRRLSVPIAVCLFWTPALAAQWTIVDLGPANALSSVGKSINESSQVVGGAYTTRNDYHAFVFDRGNANDLGTLSGASSVATGVNNQGAVVGSSYAAAGVAEHAFLSRHGKLSDLGTLGGRNSVATGINDSALVVGFSDIALGCCVHAFLYKNGKMRDLGTLGGSSSHARAINSREQVVGDSDTPGDAALHAFFYSAGRMRDLGTLGGMTSFARAINEGGQVVGDADTKGNFAHHAFIYRGATMQDLGTLGGKNSYARGINNRNQVVGYSDTTPIAVHYQFGASTDKPNISTLSRSRGMAARVAYCLTADDRGRTLAHIGDLVEYNHHAFLYREDVGMLDLSELPEVSAAGWTSLNYAEAINDRGQIVGSGTIGGRSHAFLLSPVRELTE